ncbi:MAG: helix-turn-helix transcriptional regulator [Eubacteriales bacterium]|nr:helix-turn-helix transcriptional regulator [Eubacteriales bacterium]
MTNDRLEVGRRIREFRVGRHMTQAQLAESLDVSTNFISEIETGKKGISLDTLTRLCTQYQLSADYVLFGISPRALPLEIIVENVSHMRQENLAILIRYLESMQSLRNAMGSDGADNPETPQNEI